MVAKAQGLMPSMNPATSTAFGIYFDLPKGATPSKGIDPHFVAALPIMRGHAHSDQMAFNVTETLLRLNADKMLGAKENTISIIPNRVTGAALFTEKDLLGSAAKRVESSANVIRRSATGSGNTAIPTVEQIALIER